MHKCSHTGDRKSSQVAINHDKERTPNLAWLLMEWKLPYIAHARSWPLISNDAAMAFSTDWAAPPLAFKLKPADSSTKHIWLVALE